MATFIKLSNGEIVNINYVKHIKKHDDVEPGSFRRSLKEGRQEDGGYRIDRVATIQIQLGNELNPLILKYESNHERDMEFERLETELFTEPSNDLVEIDGKIINRKHLAALYIELYRGDYRLVIKVAGMPMDTRYCSKEAGAVMMAAYKELLGVEMFDRVNQSKTQVEN